MLIHSVSELVSNGTQRYQIEYLRQKARAAVAGSTPTVRRKASAKVTPRRHCARIWATVSLPLCSRRSRTRAPDSA